MTAKEKTHCVNCGNSNHCGKKLERWEQERVNGKVTHEWKIEVCRNCLCDRCEKKK